MTTDQPGANSRGSIPDRTISISQYPGQPLVDVPLFQAWKAVDALIASGGDLVAAHMLTQVAEQIPEHPGPKLRLLGVYLDNMRLDEAAQVSDDLLLNFPRDVDVLVEVARFYHFLDDAENARKHLDEAMGIQPVHNAALHLDAVLLDAVGDSSQAVESRRNGLIHFPQDANLIFAEAASAKHKAAPELIQRTRTMVDTGQYSEKYLSLLLYSLAWFHGDDMEQHFHYLNRANALAFKLAPWMKDAHEAELRLSQQQYNKDLAAVLQQFGDQEYHPIFIAAMPRSGTTLLEQMLGAHSKVTCVGERGAFDVALASQLFENNPFSAGNDENILEVYQEHITKVIDRFKLSPQVAMAGDKRIVDKSIGNWTGIGKIMLAFPKAKILHLQRHPLDVILSCYQQSFDAGHGYSNNLEALAEQYLIFREQMDFWKSAFPDNIHSVYYENLINDPEAELASALKFCDLPWEDNCLNYRDQMSSITTASVRQVRKPLYKDSVYRWQKAEAYLQEAMVKLGDYADYRPGVS